MPLFLRLQNVVLPLGILLLGAILQLLQPYPVAFVRNLVFDQYNRWQPRTELGSPVVFVDIDEASLRKLGQFPWPRSVFADMVNKMTEAGAAAIAFLELDLIALKGKALPERIYALLGDAAMAESDAFHTQCQDQVALLVAYRAHDWDKAENWPRRWRSHMIL
jgi:hypothetical protein